MNRDVDVENGLVDTVGDVEGGMNRESSTDIIHCMCKTPSGKLAI